MLEDYLLGEFWIVDCHIVDALLELSSVAAQSLHLQEGTPLVQWHLVCCFAIDIVHDLPHHLLPKRKIELRQISRVFVLIVLT